MALKAKDNKYRSGSERRLAELMSNFKGTFKFEPYYITYCVNQTRKYLPDFVLPNGIILEVKGRFTAADRQKQLLVRKSNPFDDIRIVFDNPNNKLYKGAKSTYADWCRKHGIYFCSAKDHEVIRSWLNEKYTFVSERQQPTETGTVRRTGTRSSKQGATKPAGKNTVSKRSSTSSARRNKDGNTNGTGRRKAS